MEINSWFWLLEYIFIFLWGNLIVKFTFRALKNFLNDKYKQNEYALKHSVRVVMIWFIMIGGSIFYAGFLAYFSGYFLLFCQTFFSVTGQGQSSEIFIFKMFYFNLGIGLPLVIWKTAVFSKRQNTQ